MSWYSLEKVHVVLYLLSKEIGQRYASYIGGRMAWSSYLFIALLCAVHNSGRFFAWGALERSQLVVGSGKFSLKKLPWCMTFAWVMLSSGAAIQWAAEDLGSMRVIFRHSAIVWKNQCVSVGLRPNSMDSPRRHANHSAIASVNYRRACKYKI